MNAQVSLERAAAELKSVVMLMRIIVFALATGATMFLFIVITLTDPKELMAVPAGSDPALWIPIGEGVLALVLSRVVPALITRQMRARLVAGQLEFPADAARPPLAEVGDAGKLAMIYQTQLIVSCALLEGAAFLCAIIAMVLHGGLPALGMAIVLVLAILVKFPSPLGVASWIARQTEQVETDRTLSARNPLAKG